MNCEKEIKVFDVNGLNDKNESITIRFSELEIDDDPYYKIYVLKNKSTIIREKTFVLRDFDEANTFFRRMQNDYLGEAEKSINIEEWLTV